MLFLTPNQQCQGTEGKKSDLEMFTIGELSRKVI